MEPHPPSLARASQRDRPIDWAMLRERARAAQEANEHATQLSDERRAAVLAERARRAARPAGQLAPSGPTLELVTFKLADELYAVESRFVQEVTRMTDFTPLPGAPSCLVGVVNFRGEILSVIDLGQLFGLPCRGIGELNTLIVLRREAVRFGVLADELSRLRRIPAASLAAPVATFTGRRRALTRGIACNDTILLDADRLIVDDWSGGLPRSLSPDSQPSPSL